jgi:hypothetical protein
MTVRILVDDNFRFPDEDQDRYELGVFDTVDEALRKCRQMVDEDLVKPEPGMSQKSCSSST